MLLQVILPLAFAAVISAAPASLKEADDLQVAEGRHVSSYASPVAYGPGPAPKYGSATVTSYNRRGSYAQAGEYAKPTIYGSSYGAEPSIRSSAYSAGPTAYAPPAHGYATQELSYPAPVAGGYGDYGPQNNAYSAQSQHLSQDPSYDPAKDPVSQYAAYVPVREYSGKSHSNGNELSIYGYRK